jgi:phosphopantothenoylcysteine decarboxylase / phosphopantothenate---cysteine ligase
MSDAEARSLRVVVGVTGGIACYKAVSVVRALVQLGHEVTVVPTHSALKFVGAATWEAISHRPVSADVFDAVSEVKHVSLGQQADLVIVAPATAHFLAQYAAGLAPDLLGTTLLATHAPVAVAPAMHTEMWEHPSTVANVATLASRGVTIIGPDSGPLTGSDVGPGRMAEPEEIVQSALSLVLDHSLRGKRVLISAGGTREAIDPVRYIGNRSTGAMGVAIATEALRRGAEVTLVHTTLEVDLPRGARCVPVESARHMREAMLAEQGEADVVIMAAAVADWEVPVVSGEKLSKTEADELTLTLRKTPDILRELGEKKPEGQVLVGFAAETTRDDEDLIERARRKAYTKLCDLIVANRVGHQLGFGQTDTAVWIVQHSGAPVLSTGSKMTVAGHLLDVLP